MAKVFANSMVAHVWAQNNQPDGRSSNGNFFFEGPTLYSYGHHFAVGHIMPDGLALLNSDSYSVSTSRHQRDARQAVRGIHHYVPKLTDLIGGPGGGLKALATAATHRAAGNIERAKELEDTGRKTVVAHVETHALALSDEAAVYLLTLVKRAKSWPKIKREAEVAKRKAIADAKAAEVRAGIHTAGKMANLSEEEFLAELARREAAEPYGRFPDGREGMGTVWRRAEPAESVGVFATELHRMGVTARAHMGMKVQGVLKTRLAFVRARKARLEQVAAFSETRGRWSRLASRFRELASGFVANTHDQERNRELHRIAMALADLRRGLQSHVLQIELERVIDATFERDAAFIRAEEAARFAKEAAKRTEWLAGESSGYARLSDGRGGAMLRATHVERDDSGAIVGGTLETSHGAEAPLVHSLKAFAFVRRVVTTGKAWAANGHTIRVGHFHVDSITADGTMKAGCHTIHLAEMERLAVVLGVADTAASTEALESTHA